MGVVSLYFEAGTASMRTLNSLPLRPGWASIQPLFSGICNTDIELLRGYYGFSGVPGHEFVGEVTAVGSPEDQSWVGRRVTGEINISCQGLGTAREAWCDLCRRGWPRHCRRRRVLGIVRQRGAHAERVLLPVVNLHAIPAGISAEDAVFVEPLAAACEVLEQVRVRAGQDRVAVVGDGKLGLLIAQVLATASPAELLVIGRHRRKLGLARSWGLQTRSSNARLPVKEFDLVVDATGSPAGFEKAVPLVRPRGTLVLKSTVHDRLQVDTAPVVVDELTIVGSRCGPFERAIGLLKRKKVSLRGVVEGVYPLDEAVAAMERAQQRGTLKILLSRRC